MVETLPNDVPLVDEAAGDADVEVMLAATALDEIADSTLEMADRAGLDATTGTEIAWVTLLETGGSDDEPELTVPLDVDNDVDVVLVATGLTSALKEVTSLRVAEYGAGFPVPGPGQIGTVVVPL